MIFREWTRFTLSNERVPRDHPGLTSFNKGIIVIGGTAATENHETLDTIESFSHEANLWSIWPLKLCRPRSGPGAIQVDQRLFVIGGRGKDVEGSVEIFDQDTQSWSIHPDLVMKHPNTEYAVTLLKFL